MKNNKLINILEYELPITIQAEKEGGFVAFSRRHFANAYGTLHKTIII